MRRLAGIVVVAVAGACSGDDVVCPSAGDFVLTAPDGFVELVPGGSITVAWTSDGTGGASVQLEATATDSDDRFALPPANLEDGQVVWDGAGAPPANYRLGGQVAKVGGCQGATLPPDDLHLVVVQGLRMPTAPLAFTGAQATRTVTITSVTRSSLMVRYAVDPDLAIDGDELVFAAATLPGELAPVPRSYPFSGTTTDGTPIAAGTYTLVALVDLPTGYRAVGPTLTWTP